MIRRGEHLAEVRSIVEQGSDSGVAEDARALVDRRIGDGAHHLVRRSSVTRRGGVVVWTALAAESRADIVVVECRQEVFGGVDPIGGVRSRFRKPLVLAVEKSDEKSLAVP